MAERKVFGRVQFDHDGRCYMVELTRRGLVVWEKKHRNKTTVGIRAICKLLEPQAEFFMISKPKEQTTGGERAINELKEVHATLSDLSGAATDGNNWRSLLSVLTRNQKDKNEIRTDQ